MTSKVISSHWSIALLNDVNVLTQCKDDLYLKLRLLSQFSDNVVQRVFPPFFDGNSRIICQAFHVFQPFSA